MKEATFTSVKDRAVTAAKPVLSLIIPALNEQGAIAKVLNSALETLREFDFDTEIILVNDGSTDETGKVAERIEGVRVVHNPRRLGYGHSLLRGMHAASGEYFAISDADGSYPIESLHKLWEIIESGADHAIGQRSGKHFVSHFGSRAVYRLLCKYVVGESIPDANSGLRIFHSDIVREVRGDLCLGFSFTTSLTLASHMSGRVVVFTPIEYNERTGTSHVRRVRDIARTLQYLFQLIALYNPTKLYLPFIAVTALLAIAGFIYGTFFGQSNLGGIAGLFMTSTTFILIGMMALSYIVSRTQRDMGKIK
ncbi:MAG: glycosyltransferase family 2 protein [Planctomycetota bacterium]